MHKIVVKNVEYPSLSAATIDLGVSHPGVYARLKKLGWPDKRLSPKQIEAAFDPDETGARRSKAMKAAWKRRKAEDEKRSESAKKAAATRKAKQKEAATQAA